MEPAAGQTNILLVDDRPDKLLALRTMLEELDANLVCARSGAEALRKLLHDDFAVILLDVNMPGMDGFDTAAMIRQRKRSETTPIIFISAVNDTETHVSRGYSLGAVDYILTPVVPEILRAKIAVFVDLHRKTEQIKRQAEEHAELIREQAARAEAEAGRRRSAFLAEASNVLSGSLDYGQTFENLARLVVPDLADMCLIDRLEDDGRLSQVTVAHRDPEKEPILRRIRYPEPGERHIALKVFETGEPELCRTIPAELVPHHFPGDEELFRELAPKSYIAVPLIARGRILGSITMVSASEERPFTPGDLSLAVELAQRAALALDNASLYRSANQARQEAEAANKAKDRFLAMLSHELRTPLTPVITSLINLQSKESLPWEIQQPLALIRRNVELEARLIDDLLDLTRVGSGKIQLQPEVTDARALLENAVEICRPEIDAKGLRLNVRCATTHTHVSGDPARLQQIFWNLLKNAVKFTNEGGIDVSLEAPDDSTLQIRVRDSGVGITPEFLPRIFKPFEQDENGKFGGLGLGLSITRALVGLHGGTIDVTSEGKNHGATFTVRLPLVEPPAEPADEPPTHAHDRNGAPLRILLLEDHVDSNHTLTMFLQLRGYDVTPAFCVTEAVEFARDRMFDVLISDLGLPDGSAGDVMGLLATRGSTIGIAVSGYGMEEDIVRSRAYGFTHHLVKPVEINRLEALLDQLAAGGHSSNGA